MSASFGRYLRILELLPVAPAKKPITRIHAELEASGHGVGVRSIQRALIELARQLPIRGDDAKPQGWSWEPGTPRTMLPALDPLTRFTHMMLLEYLRPLLPRALAQVLEDMAGRKAGKGRDDAALARWARKVAALPSGPDRIAPHTDRSVVEAVYQAVFEQRQLEVQYRKAGADKPSTRHLHPAGLVLVDETVYLVAMIEGRDDALQWALHRIVSAHIVDEPAHVPPGFDLQHYIRESRAFQYSHDWVVRLELLVDPWLAAHLEERPLAENQTVTAVSGRREKRVRATVEYTDRLHWWLRSWGDAVEVVKPVSLRRDFAAEYAKLASVYAAQATSEVAK